MKGLGELLKQARLAKNLTLEEISARTKIDCRYLEALERGDSSPFAAEIYFKGMLRNYALAVDLDPQELLNRYYRSKGGSAQSGEDTAGRERDENAANLVHRNRRIRPLQWISFGRSKQARPFETEKGPSYRAGIILLALVFLAGMIYVVSNGFPEKQPQTPPVENGVPEKQGQPPSDPVESGPEEQEPAVVCTGTAEGETTFTVGGPAPLEFSVSFEGRCWVQILTDGRESYQGNYQHGAEIALTAANTVWIRLGYPPAVRLTVNGTEIEGLTEKKSPHNYRFTLQ